MIAVDAFKLMDPVDVSINQHYVALGREMENNGEGVRKGAWTREEDILLRDCVDRFGEGKWHLVPLRAGLNRCRKSCRLRWLNYLRPNLKRGYFNKDEVDLIVRLHKLLGNRWSLIAGRLPGRTANDVKNFWNTHISKKPPSPTGEARRGKFITESNIVRPRPRSFSNLQLHALSNQLTRSPSSAPLIENREENDDGDAAMKEMTYSMSEKSTIDKAVDRSNSDENPSTSSLQEDLDECIRWWGDLLEMTETGEETPFIFPEEEPTFLDGIHDLGSNGAVHGEVCGGLSLGGEDLELEQFIGL